MGSFTEKAAFLRSKRKLRWRNLKSCPRRSRSDGASKHSARGKSRRPWMCCRPRWGHREAGYAQEKIYKVDESCSCMATLSCPLIIRVARRCMRFITAMSRRRYGEDACWPYFRIGLQGDLTKTAQSNPRLCLHGFRFQFFGKSPPFQQEFRNRLLIGLLGCPMDFSIYESWNVSLSTIMAMGGLFYMHQNQVYWSLWSNVFLTFI